MLNEKEIMNLLKEALRNYIKCLERNDFDYLEHKGEIVAYINVLNMEGLNAEFLDISKAKELLNII